MRTPSGPRHRPLVACLAYVFAHDCHPRLPPCSFALSLSLSSYAPKRISLNILSLSCAPSDRLLSHDGLLWSALFGFLHPAAATAVRILHLSHHPLRLPQTLSTIILTRT
ncbi:hypothetical protein BCV70DRAFT_199107 [Testicularia cyperi]|uniref:Uncharacterized protein n=1 Tax=Testicularia cyperi TaxID=1882483 RepID=A0A317XTK3_9BASI|nr:hypothetical protein BCV70DRAFT_199107 [Testicularia cyperi]